MAFAPDRLVRTGYAVSAVVLVLLLAMLALRRPPPAAAPPPRVADHGVPVLPARRAAVMALAAGAVLGFVFAARVAPPIALATYVVLRRGTGARALASAAGALLVVVVPVLTLAIPVRNRGGYNPEYAQSRIAVHWVAVAAVVLLILALARELGAARRRRSPARRPPLPPVTAPARGPRPRSQWRSRGAATP
jgi:membrane protease YdiL (CAAX protease family)